MPKYASLFPTTEDAEHAVAALKESRMGDLVRAEIVSEEDWKTNWGEPEDFDPAGENASREYLDIWMDETQVSSFSKGLEMGGAVLVIDVPEEHARQALKILKDNRGKFE